MNDPVGGTGTDRGPGNVSSGLTQGLAGQCNPRKTRDSEQGRVVEGLMLPFYLSRGRATCLMVFVQLKVGREGEKTQAKSPVAGEVNP